MSTGNSNNSTTSFSSTSNSTSTINSNSKSTSTSTTRSSTSTRTRTCAGSSTHKYTHACLERGSIGWREGGRRASTNTYTLRATTTTTKIKHDY